MLKDLKKKIRCKGSCIYSQEEEEEDLRSLVYLLRVYIYFACTIKMQAVHLTERNRIQYNGNVRMYCDDKKL